MDSQSPFASSLSVEETLLITSACRLLESESKQTSFRFWGKVLGTQNDYFVVQSSILHPFKAPLTYYSRDARIWQTLPQVNPVLRKRTPRLNGMFTGDPTFTSNFVEYHYAGETYYEPTTMTVKEEERLAYLVHCVDSEGIIFPKGSVDLDEKGFLVKNPLYEGLSYDDCHDFASFVSYKPRGPQTPQNPDIGIQNPSHYFLRPLTESMPMDHSKSFGPWLFRDAPEENSVLLENVHWPGLYFWQNINNANNGRVYLGRGEKELDAPFIIGNADEQSLSIDIDVVPDYDHRAVPEDALKAAEEEFLADEARREAMLPPLPVPEPAAVSEEQPVTDDESEGRSKGEGDETSAEGEETSEAPSENQEGSASATDVSESEAEA